MVMEARGAWGGMVVARWSGRDATSASSGETGNSPFEGRLVEARDKKSQHRACRTASTLLQLPRNGQKEHGRDRILGGGGVEEKGERLRGRQLDDGEVCVVDGR